MDDPAPTVLVVGGTGATGRLLLAALLARGCRVRAIVRPTARVPEALRKHEALELIESPVLDLPPEALRKHVQGCDGVASCLGHSMSFRGVFGPPWRLVTRAVQRLCDAIRACEGSTPVRFVLMSSAGVRNRDLDEPISFGQHVVMALLRLLVPPHRDNERAAEVLRVGVGPGDARIHWCAVRPDSLQDEDAVAPHDLVPSPTRSVIFDPGRTSRIQVADVMARLLVEGELWERWRGRMPVVYDRGESAAAPGS